MRETRFRAWDKENKLFIMSGNMPDYAFWKWVAYDSTTLITQFTGLKDKNGKEIYEGDIVRFSEHFFGDSTERECVEVIEWDEKEAGYPWKLTNTGFCDGPHWCEIIGNIYENPELVKP